MILVQGSLSAETIQIVDKAENVGDVITRLAEKLAAFLDSDAERIARAVQEREATRSTAFSNGAAIPHCRLPELKRFGVAIMILRHPVRWDNEGHAVDTIVMIAGPTNNVADHLRILANSSQLLDSSAFRSKIKTAPDSESAYKLIGTAEKAIEKLRSQEGMLRELHRDKANGGHHDRLADAIEGFRW